MNTCSLTSIFTTNDTIFPPDSKMNQTISYPLFNCLITQVWKYCKQVFEKKAFNKAKRPCLSTTKKPQQNETVTQHNLFLQKKIPSTV